MLSRTFPMASFRLKSSVGVNRDAAQQLLMSFFYHTVTSFQKCDPCPTNIECVPAIQCPAHIRMTKQPQLCDLPGSGTTHGLCCTTRQNHTSKDFFKKHEKLRSNDANLVDNVLRDAKMEFKMMIHKERNHRPVFVENRIVEPDHFHQMVFGYV